MLVAGQLPTQKTTNMKIILTVACLIAMFLSALVTYSGAVITTLTKGIFYDAVVLTYTQTLALTEDLMNLIWGKDKPEDEWDF